MTARKQVGEGDSSRGKQPGNWFWEGHGLSRADRILVFDHPERALAREERACE